jgi:hypothetical protein
MQAPVPDIENETQATTDIQAAIDKYKMSYTNLMNQVTNQRTTLETVDVAKNKIKGIEEDLHFSVNTFGKQIEDIRNQINIDKKHVHKETINYFDSILNVLIIVALIFAIYSLGKVAYSRIYPSPSLPVKV